MFPQVTSSEISWLFPDFFLTQSQFWLTFCSTKICYFDLCRNSHGSHRCKINFCSDHLVKNKYDLSFLCAIPTKLWLDLQNVIEIRFLISLHFLSMTERLSNHIMTLTVIIWNEGFILISTSFILTFSWISTFPDPYQNFLTFSDFDFFLTCGNPVNTVRYFVMFCHGYMIIYHHSQLIYLSISFRVASLALGQSYDCPSASEATLRDMGKTDQY